MQSLDWTHQTFNIDFTHTAEGRFSFTSVSNIGLARHFCRLCPLMPLTFNHSSLLAVMTYTTQTKIHIQHSLSAPVSHTTWHTRQNLNTLIISAVYQLTNDSITTNLSKSHSPFLWHAVCRNPPNSSIIILQCGTEKISVSMLLPFY